MSIVPSLDAPLAGRLIAVVGPSGVGKDSVMTALAARKCELVLARRVITRANEDAAEAFESVSIKEFLKRQSESNFALSWSAYGLSYGVPRDIDLNLLDGWDVLANLSRSVLSQASRRYASFEVVHLTASSTVLRERLTARGREGGDDIERRLHRRPKAIADGIKVHEIDNSGALSDTVEAVLSALYPEHQKPMGAEHANTEKDDLPLLERGCSHV